MGKLRVCTDGRIANKHEKKRKTPYDDQHHQGTTACFQGTVASDAIPYIVIPNRMKAYKFSCGAIVDRESGNYLYGVVADTGGSKPVGEVSIYAAWLMTDVKPPVNHVVGPEHRIGNKDQEGKWKIVLFKKSAPNSKKDHCGWNYKKTKTLREHIKKIGKQCYKGTGRCLN